MSPLRVRVVMRMEGVLWCLCSCGACCLWCDRTDSLGTGVREELNPPFLCSSNLVCLPACHVAVEVVQFCYVNLTLGVDPSELYRLLAWRLVATSPQVVTITVCMRTSVVSAAGELCKLRVQFTCQFEGVHSLQNAAPSAHAAKSAGSSSH
jgi:hypothetical protein